VVVAAGRFFGCGFFFGVVVPAAAAVRCVLVMVVARQEREITPGAERHGR